MKRKYRNLHIKEIRRGPVDFLKWQLGFYDDILPSQEIPKDFVYPFPSLELKKDDPIVLWINHCTFLIQVEGISILTDPIWSHRCSPLPFLGPKRRHLPPISIDHLPPIDMVLLSHNHYDHLDAKTIQKLYQRFPSIIFIVPEGVKRWFTKRGYHHVKELSWWQESEISLGANKPRVIISSVPAQHHSGRGIFDANKTLWMGLVVEILRKNNDPKTLYFVGDTAYNPFDFKKIGERFKKIDLCLCPIGTYKPNRFMQTVHSSPDDAVNIHTDVRAELSIGMHWKTFNLGEEGSHTPPYDLYRAMLKKGLNPARFLPVEPGIGVNW